MWIARRWRWLGVGLVAAWAGACGARDAIAPAPARAVAPPPWTDAWILAEGARYRQDVAYRRGVLEQSLVNHDNTYSRQRLASYGRGASGWDRLPIWNPRSRQVLRDDVAQLERGERPPPGQAPLWNGVEPTTMAGWVALGRRVFFEYPMRAEVFFEWGITRPDLAAAVGVERDEGGNLPGIVTFADVDGEVRVGITCALCHSTVRAGTVVEGAARRSFDYGRLRLAYFDATGGGVDPALAARMAGWGPGRADVTEDDDEDPVAIPDLWGLRSQRHLTQAGTIRHETPAALAIRQETQLIDSNHAMVRPPRALSWALVAYLYSLAPPPRAPATAATADGASLFAQHCAGCHANEAFGGGVWPAAAIGTDPALARSRGRGTGNYRVPALLDVAASAPYLHDGSVASLDELLRADRLDPSYAGGRLGPGPIPGHPAGTQLSAADRDRLIAYLASL